MRIEPGGARDQLIAALLPEVGEVIGQCDELFDSPVPAAVKLSLTLVLDPQPNVRGGRFVNVEEAQAAPIPQAAGPAQDLQDCLAARMLGRSLLFGPGVALPRRRQVALVLRWER